MKNKLYKKYKYIRCDTCKKYTRFELVKLLQLPSYYGSTRDAICIMAIHQVYKCPKCGSTYTYVHFEDTKIDEVHNNENAKT